MARFLKVLGWKTASGVMLLATVVVGITWWQMDPSTRQSILSGGLRIVAWLGMVGLLPWATFFVIRRVAEMDSNTAAGILVGAYTVLELLVLLWLFGWRIGGGTAWVFVAVGVLLAAVYNILVCDWIAEKLAS